MGSAADMNAPIEQSVLEDPKHPVTKTILYIYSMESPIRYALHDATKARDDSQLINLGALAYALKVIVATATTNRDDIPQDDKPECCFGLPMIEQQISDIKEFEPTKKQPEGPAFNWPGFTACFNRKSAQEDARKFPSKETTPCILSIESD